MEDNNQLLQLLQTMNKKLDSQGEIIVSIEQRLKDQGETIAGIEQGLKDQGEAIASIEQRVKDQEDAIARLEKGQATHQTALKALGASNQDLREEVKTIRVTMVTTQSFDISIDVAKSEIRADINLLHANVLKEVLNHRKRIENIESTQDIPNPDKH